MSRQHTASLLAITPLTTLLGNVAAMLSRRQTGRPGWSVYARERTRRAMVGVTNGYLSGALSAEPGRWSVEAERSQERIGQDGGSPYLTMGKCSWAFGVGLVISSLGEYTPTGKPGEIRVFSPHRRGRLYARNRLSSVSAISCMESRRRAPPSPHQWSAFRQTMDAISCSPARPLERPAEKRFWCTSFCLHALPAQPSENRFCNHHRNPGFASRRMDRFSDLRMTGWAQ